MSKILVIEDEPAILENVLETLQMEGFAVHGAPNGVVGVQRARDYLPDLIICDIMMPELNGYGVLLELRKAPVTANIPFMFLTARADRSDMRKGMELGADDYLIKPFTAVELLNAVNARIERQTSITEEYERRLDDLRGNIVRALPHELRTPLTGIIGYSEMLLMDFDSFERQQVINMVDSIYGSGMRLYHLIENYLLYAQLEVIAVDSKRREALQTHIVKSGAIIAKVALEKAQTAGRGGDLHLEIEDVAVHIAQDALAKVVEELVDNAFKFSEAGTPVSVKATHQNHQLVLTVCDQGRGISAEDIKRIGAYMQFERALYEQQGLGLGLILSRRLVEVHGGELTVESEPEQGTTVSIKLPAVLSFNRNGNFSAS